MSTTPENNVTQPRPIVPATAPRLRLVADAPTGPVWCETTRPVTLAGSRRDCQLPLNDPEVSKVHCAIVHTGTAFLICDLCSRSGTHVNGRAVRVGPLCPGDRLRMGTVAARVELAAPSPAAVVSQQDTRPPQRLMLLVRDRTIVLSSGKGPVSGRPVDLQASVALLGRRGTCDVLVDTPDVSLVHALVFGFDGRPAIADLGSRSGTLLNGERVQLVWLHEGDRLNIGGVILTVTCDDATRAWLPARPEAALHTVAPDGATLEPPAGSEQRDADAVAGLLDAVVGDLSAARHKLDQRAAELDRRDAELDALAALVKLQFEQIETIKAELARRQAEVQHAAEEAQERLALALSHEQAAAAAWRELERRQASREDADAASREPVPASARPHLAFKTLLKAVPLARPAPPNGGESPAAGGLTNV